jgi:hypothetical protein
VIAAVNHGPTASMLHGPTASMLGSADVGAVIHWETAIPALASVTD